MWFAIAFHVMIEITSSVQVFSYAALAALSIWVTPSTRDRTVRVGSDVAADLVRAGDWYARFRVERRGAGEPVTAVDRDGTVRTGRAAVGLVLSRLPVTFPLRRAAAGPRRVAAMRTGVRLASAAAIWVGGFAVLRVSALAPEDCPTRPADVLDDSARAGGTWIERGQDADGRYVYEYDRAADEVLPGYNIVRHAGVTMSLYQLARAGHDDVLAVADAGDRRR